MFLEKLTLQHALLFCFGIDFLFVSAIGSCLYMFY